MSNLLLFCVVLAVSYGLGHALRYLLLRYQVLDNPNERSNHRVPVPRGGGIAILLAIAFGGIVANLGNGFYELAALVAVLAVVSFVDDLRSLPILMRLVVQGVTAYLGLALISQQPILFDGMPLWLDNFCTVLLWVWFMNLYNFMDGIDGITGVETVSILLGLWLIAALTGYGQNNLAVYGVIIASVLGFLVINWHPAKLFMGDVGSVPLGYLIGFFLLGLCAQGMVISAMLLCLYYLLDSSITLAGRVLKREKFWQAHSQHYYQQAVRNGKSHSHVSACIGVLNMGLVALACAAAIFPDYALVCLVCGLLLCFGLLRYFSHKGRG